MPYQPSIGDVVTIPTLNGDVGEVELLLASNTVGVRIVQEESAWRGQLVYFNAGQLEPVNFGR